MGNELDEIVSLERIDRDAHTAILRLDVQVIDIAWCCEQMTDKLVPVVGIFLEVHFFDVGHFEADRLFVTMYGKCIVGNREIGIFGQCG